MAASNASFAHAGLIALLVTSAVAPQGVYGQDIFACGIRGSGFTNSRSQQVGVAAAANATAYVCDSPEVTTVESSALTVATEIAIATATAIADVYAECAAESSSSVRLNGLSLAVAEASAIVSSFAEATTAASVCGRCNIITDVMIDTFRVIYITATEQAEVILEGSSTGERIEDLTDAFVDQIVSGTTIALANFLIVARAEVEHDCGRFFSGAGGSQDACAINVNATDGSTVHNTITDSVVDVVAEACGLNETVDDDFEVSAMAIATAMGRAIAEISAGCVVQVQRTACVISRANILATAVAVANAFHFVFADVISACFPPQCDESASFLTNDITEILASATSSAMFAQCSSMGDQFSVTVLEEEIITASITALSKIIGQFTVLGNVCDIDLTLALSPQPGATPLPAPALMPSAPTSAASLALPACRAQCARNNQKCDGTTFDSPAACCSPDHLCVRRNSRFSQCRLDGEPGFGTWEGTITMCKS